MPSRALILILTCLALAPCAWSQRQRPQARLMGPPPQLIERLERMTPEQRRRVLDRLPPGRRANVERKLARYESLAPEQRERVRRNFERFRDLPPNRQRAARQLFNQLQSFPVQRRVAVREEFRTLRQMPAADRKVRLAGEEFRNRFDASERRWVEDALDTMRP